MPGGRFVMDVLSLLCGLMFGAAVVLSLWARRVPGRDRATLTSNRAYLDSRFRQGFQDPARLWVEPGVDVRARLLNAARALFMVSLVLSAYAIVAGLSQ